MNSEPISGAAAAAAILPAIRGATASAATDPSPAASSATAPQTAPATPSANLDAQVRQAAEESNKKLSQANIALQFQVDLTPTGAVRSVKLLDSADHSVVMQFPSEQMLAVRDSIDQMLQSSEKGGVGALAGALFSKTA